MMSRHRRFFRLAAALLAWAGMSALPLRSLAACPMLAPAATPAMHHAMVGVGADEHAGHDMTGMDAPMPESPASPASPGAPTHETCPDLAHCAVAAVQTPVVLAVAPTAPLVAVRLASQTAPLSVALALEPPPPKA